MLWIVSPKVRLETKNRITMNKIKAISAAGILTMVGAVSTQAQNIVVNGDFTANAAAFAVAPGLMGGGNPTSITGWTLGLGSLGVGGSATAACSGYGPANAGAYTFSFIHWGSVDGSSALSQVLSINYTPSTTYDLSFDAASFRWAPNHGFRVSINDNSTTHFTTQVGAVDLDASATDTFNHYTYSFTSPASFNGPATLSVMNVEVGNNAVDFANVSLVAVIPEPTTTALASLGLLLAGFNRWSRRRSA